MKLFKGLQRPSFGFEVKIHRIAVNGPVVLTERTDVLRLGRCGCSSGCAVSSK